MCVGIVIMRVRKQDAITLWVSIIVVGRKLWKCWSGLKKELGKGALSTIQRPNLFLVSEMKHTGPVVIGL